MDDIQFWLYLVFGAIYFITRSLKKKNPPQPKSRPQQQTDESTQRRNRPVTFEELLQEFTEGKSTPKEEEKPEPVEATQVVKERKWQEENRPKEYEEGKTRRFSDEESRKVYEESIKRAEGTELEFKRDEHFQSKLKSRAKRESESNEVAADVLAMLQDQDQAKRAVVLSEILNRKY
ncbi:hypothetical protein [Marinoscillum furvescens]|uniref:Uncharacterized protein n=1 Tax=Marinoscillum furvescens DSM 4134 TaxID=1122208 RepID=A0A3D9L1K8_MARFU|nr:hypothetical protein [Marinoscillum furvescens]RED96113.1 hypothetical protein C7460_1152 [Marinoscillum furvescens DSM 4134]